MYLPFVRAKSQRNASGEDSFEHSLDFAQARGDWPDVLAEYGAWHTAKGYWPNETPLGEVKT